MDSVRFFKLRENALKTLEKAMKEDKVDEDMIDILKMINEKADLFTTSSCSGRIVLMEVPHPGAKPGARFLGKWHEGVNTSNIIEAVSKAEKGYIIFMVHPPIIHVVAKDQYSAEKILKMGLSSGFKNSGMRAFRGKIVVELQSTERMDVLIGKDGRLMVDIEYLDVLSEFANLMLQKGKKKLEILRKNMDRFWQNRVIFNKHQTNS